MEAIMKARLRPAPRVVDYDIALDSHIAPTTFSDKIAYIFVRFLRFFADKFFAKRYGCLLYTSPSPRDATLSRMPSSA